VLIEAAYRSGKSYREGMEAAYEKFVEIALAQPAAAHLVFVDSLRSAPPPFPSASAPPPDMRR
jgi:hypothetical protein